VNVSMVRVKLNQETWELASFVENHIRALVKDCFQDEDTVYVIVSPGEMRKAVGKGGRHILEMQQRLNKKIRVVEFCEPAEEFIKNLIYPLAVEQISEQDTYYALRDRSLKTKGLLIGRGRKNLRFLNRAVQRFFNKEVKVV